jgi:hypothetical protein
MIGFHRERLTSLEKRPATFQRFMGTGSAIS